MLVESIVGWLVHGVVGEADRPDQAALMLFVKASQQEIEGAPEEMLKRIFDIDGLGGGKNQDEKDPAEEQFKNSLTTEEGRYCVTLPWKDGHPLLPTYEEAASAQLRSQLRRMKRCPEVLEKYDKQLKDYVEGGFAEIIDPKAESSEGGIVTYIPHLEVIRLDKSSTKVRPVFNASFGKPSLNSCLNSGPNLVPPMVEILLRFRSHRITLTADIEKAFLQIALAVGDRNATRFLWAENPFEENPKIIHLRWKRVVFGLTCSPFHLTATLRLHLENYKQSHPRTAALMGSDMFVDDLISGADSREEAEIIAKEAVAIAADAKMPLRRWRTNDQELQKKLSALCPSEQAATQLIFQGEDVTKVLGTVWDRERDVLTFETAAIVEHCATIRHRTNLRTVLSVSSRVYDPLGLISPVVIFTRILMQRIWKRRLDWDEELPAEMKRELWKWVDQLQDLAAVSVPRWYAVNLSKVQESELHVFCDASKKAYGSVAYLRCTEQTRRTEVNIIASRARVAPLDPPTLPRLELLGGHLAAGLATQIKKAMGGAKDHLLD